MVLVLLIVTKWGGRQSPEEIRRGAHKEIEVPEAAALFALVLPGISFVFTSNISADCG